MPETQPAAESPRRDLRQVLGKVPLFAEFDTDELGSLAELTKTRRYTAREVVFQQGDVGGAVFAILAGHVKVISPGPDGRDTVLAIMGPGEVFGEVSLLDGETRSATVTALEPSELAVISREVFLPFLERSPKLAIKLMQVLARRLRRLSERSEYIASLDVSARLAKTLVDLAVKYGEGDSPVRIRVRLSQQELGEMIGATRESVNKHLRHWMEQGLTRKEGGHLLICDRAALERMASYCR
jgi:CRP-like cAMP-binding protein